MSEKSLVVGAAGFIGGVLTARLLELGHSVLGVDSFNETLYPATNRRKKIMELQLRGLQFVEEDASRSGVLDDLVKDVDVVYNLAAVPGLTPSWTNFEAYEKANVLLVQRLLHAIKELPSTHLVHASTSSIFGAHAGASSEEVPNSPYGVTKLAAEKLIRAYSDEFGVSYTILRYFSVYGLEPRPDQFFALILERLSRGEPIVIFGDGNNSRTNTHVDDIVEATIRAGTMRSLNCALSISGTEPATTQEIVNMVAAEMGVTPLVTFQERRRGDQRATEGDIGPANAVLGWVPQISLAEGIKAMVSDYLGGSK